MAARRERKAAGRWPLPGLRRDNRGRVRVPLLPGLRVGAVRMTDGRAEAQTHRRTEESLGPVRPCVPAPSHPPAAKRAQFAHLPIKSILNSPEQTGMGFWSLNPYVGCEFGCSYCYARFAHRYVVERSSGGGALRAGVWDEADFERRVFVKSEAPDVLALTLKPSRLAGAAIAIGTATDPYQPAERRFLLTRRILERLAQFHGLNVSLVTKSSLVARDLDVLTRLAARSRLTVYLSLISVEIPLIRRLEARSPMPQVRLRALQKLAAGGIRAGVMVAPVVPGVTDGVAPLRALMRAAREAGAAFVHASPLRLYPAVRPTFLPIVARHFPALLPRYQRAFDARGTVTAAYADALERRVQRLAREAGFSGADATRARRPGSTGATGRRGGPSLDDLGQWVLPI
jgi:DNA repair photolyase